MNFGIGTYTFGWAMEIGSRNADARPEQDLLDFARSRAIRLVQFGDNLPLHTFPAERLHALRRMGQEGGFEFELGARRLEKAHLLRYAGLAEFFNARLLRFVIDDAAYTPGLEEVAKLLTAHLGLLEEKGLFLAIENHDRFKAVELAQLMETVNSPQVGICLDTVNSLGANEGGEWVVRTLAPFTLNLHVKDFEIRRLPHKMGFTVSGKPAGQGMLDLPRVMAELAPFGRLQSAILELWTPPEQEIALTLRKERQWAEESLNYLIPFFTPAH